MKTVSAREANQHFSKLLASAAAGEDVVITRRGEPVARLSPYRPAETAPERMRAAKRLLRRLRKGVKFSGGHMTRDEMHDR